jgi:predicted metal-dependent phosphoesterase TrpH
MLSRVSVSIIRVMKGVADLHSHSRLSDGTLAVADLVALAAGRGVQLMALTDHDEVSGVAAGRAAAAAHGIQFVGGVEVSSEWCGLSIHVVGLRIDENEPNLARTLQDIRQRRTVRAHQMSESFSAFGIDGVLAGAMSFAPNPDLLSRTHFARHLVDSGVCRSIGEVFSRFMKPGKPGYVAQQWISVADAVATIHGAGGRAVLAHPGRYDTTWTGGPSGLLKAFAEVGGDGVEVVCGAHHPHEWAEYATLARKFSLLASIGSDFHSPSESRVKFGDLPPLSPSLRAVWHDWPEAESLYV